MFAKLVNNTLIPAPEMVSMAGQEIYNPRPETLRSLGYKEVIYPDAPQLSDMPGLLIERPTGMPMSEVYAEDDDHIYVTHIAVPSTSDARTYAQRVEGLIREQYSVSDELAILRQRDTKAAEFEEYFAFCEQCKNNIKSEIEDCE